MHGLRTSLPNHSIYNYNSGKTEEALKWQLLHPVASYLDAHKVT